jgi:hypothetical protein
MGEVTMDGLNQAIPLFVGWGVSSFPKEDGKRIIDRFGLVEGRKLSAEVQALVDELRGITPDWSKHTLVSAGQWAVAQLKSRHPELSDEAASALNWLYTWWWK